VQSTPRVRMTSAFDDDEFSGNYVNVNDFNDDDDDVMDDWEEFLDEEEEAAKKKKEKEIEQEQKQLEKEKKMAKRLQEKAEQERVHALMNAKPLTKEEQELAQKKGAQAAANDLFGFNDETSPKTEVHSTKEITKSTAALSLSNPDSIDNYIPIEPDDFEELARRVAKKLKNYKDDDGYNKFIKDLISELCSDMTSEEIKKVSTPLATLTHEKSRQEKDAKKKAQQTAAKKGVLNMPKKNTEHSDFYLNEYQAQRDYDYDDCEDDFM